MGVMKLNVLHTMTPALKRNSVSTHMSDHTHTLMCAESSGRTHKNYIPGTLLKFTIHFLMIKHWHYFEK